MKKVIHWLHLWLGLISGLVVFIVGTTGCLYVFNQEIEAFTAPYQHAAIRQQAVLLPSVLKKISETALPGKKAKFVRYQPGKSAYAGLFDAGYSLGFYADPYTGQKLKVVDFLGTGDFFAFILHGHRALWLPYPIGRPIVDTAVLIFIILLISGMVLWWPKNLKKANRDKSFRIKWGASIKRINYDLHNVLGFYAMFVLLVMAITGSVWGYQWVAKSVYFSTSGGKSLPEFVPPTSDTLTNRTFRIEKIDLLYERLRAQNPEALLFIFFPQTSNAAIQVNINHQPGKNYDTELLYFDQYTLKALSGSGVFTKRFRDAAFPDQLSRLNYDLHTGQLWGLPTKLLAFSASLVCASLPVTGFCIWWGKTKKKKKKKTHKNKDTCLNSIPQPIYISKK